MTRSDLPAEFDGDFDGDDLAVLTTETADERYTALDTASVAQLATWMNAADTEVPAAVNRALPQIIAAIEAIVARLRRGGRLIYVGAGTPGRLGVLDASECPPTFGTDPDLVVGVIAGGDAALLTAQEGVEDDAGAGRAMVGAHDVTADDVVVGISSSGRTPFVLAAVSAARERGALGVGISCNAGTALSAAAEHGIEVVVGPEVLAGSTRLKSGTAQKLVLNMISTIAMVRLGKVYDNLMVDIRPTNRKLRERAVRMVRTITGASRPQALDALRASNFHVKTAVLLIARGLDADEARAALSLADGHLRAALDAPA